ncbi:hypothetical protein Hanom_Chr00s000796g01661591 [Helianthus anomalus]
MEDDVEDNTKLFDVRQEEISDMNKRLAKMNDINQTLNQLISELHEASANEMKAIKLEMEGMKADKVMKDNQLNMLYAFMYSHLNIDVLAAFNEIEVKRAEERRVERERRLAKEVKQKNKGVIEETQETGGSSSHVDVEMTEDEANPMGFMLFGESSSLSFDLNEIIRRVHVLQKKKNAKEVLMLKWKDEEEVEEETHNFVLIGKPSSVPYSLKEIVRRVKFDERRREARKARGEIVSDSDIEILDDEEEEDENDKSDKKDDKDNKKDDDDQSSSGLFIVNPYVEQRMEDFLNDKINEQEDGDHQESYTSGKQHTDRPGQWLRCWKNWGWMFKFDIEDEKPQSPEKEYEFEYAAEADKYNEVIVEDASDSSDEETDFHYSGVDEIFPSFAEMYKDQNEDKIRRQIGEKISTEGVPKTIPRENLAEERKKWFKVMPKERKSLRALQYFTYDKNISW